MEMNESYDDIIRTFYVLLTGSTCDSIVSTHMSADKTTSVLVQHDLQRDPLEGLGLGRYY